MTKVSEEADDDEDDDDGGGGGGGEDKGDKGEFSGENGGKVKKGGTRRQGVLGDDGVSCRLFVRLSVVRLSDN